MRSKERSPKLLEMIRILTQAEINIFFAFEAAAQGMISTKFRYTLNRLKKDHYHHFQGLCSIIQELGGVPPRLAPDERGYLIESFTLACSSIGLMGAFRAIESNEKIVNAIYDEILNLNLPKRIRLFMEKSKKDEETHLFILEKLAKIDLYQRHSATMTA